MRALKLYQKPVDTAVFFKVLDEFRIDTVLLGQSCLDAPGFLAELGTRGISRRIIEPVFLIDHDGPLDPEDDHVALLASGMVAKADWVQFACPTSRSWRNSLMTRLVKNASLGLEGQNLDFIRFFTFWETMTETDSTAQVLETCFCPTCMASLAEYGQLALPPWAQPESVHSRSEFAVKIQPWVAILDVELLPSWRQNLITRLVHEAVDAIKAEHPASLIGLHALPWTRDSFNGAARRKLGQDLPALAGIVDWFSPMVYHHMMGRQPSFIHDLVLDHTDQISGARPIIPCIQVKSWYKQSPYSDGEIESAIEAALAEPSGGIAFFRYEDFDDNPGLVELVARVLKKGSKAS